MQASDERTKHAETQVSVTAPKDTDASFAAAETQDHGEASPQSAGDGSPGPSLRRTGRGMSMRRRIGLKIEADENGGHRSTTTAADGASKESEGRNAEDANGEGGGEGAWWKVEYKAPPPGHLGAHSVPVSVTGEEEVKSPTSALTGRGRSQSMEASEHELGRVEMTSSEISVEHIPRTHETPERASRKARGGSDRYDESMSHSSPNQKRKIIDLHDGETGTFPTMGVAKEPKRFHETNGSQITLQQSEGESELSRTMRTAAVTPSKLLHPMTQIDLEAGSSTGPSDGSHQGSAASLGAHGSVGRASESA